MRAEFRDRVILVGDAAEAVILRDDLEAHPERPAWLVEHLTPAESRGDGGRSKPLTELVLSSRATLVVLGRAGLAEASVVDQMAALHEAGIRVRTVSAFYDEWLGKLPAAELDRAALMFDIREVHGGRYARTKRLCDVAIGVMSLVPLALAIPVVAVANLAGNRGPLLYRQERVGKNGSRFTILKLRTMRPAGEGDSPGAWTAEADPRVTPVGSLLRKTHIDELPQVLNILRGDLSVVGPRPEQPRYVEELVEKLPFYDLRHVIRPGLTGWAQVKYGYAGDERGALEKLQYDFWYLQHQSLALDLRVIGRTIRSVSGRGSRAR